MAGTYWMDQSESYTSNPKVSPRWFSKVKWGHYAYRANSNDGLEWGIPKVGDILLCNQNINCIKNVQTLQHITTN